MRDKMKKEYIKIHHIPAVLWGETSKQLFIAVHGNMSHKEDDTIIIFAEEVTSKGYQLLSFDLPEHGDRKTDPTLCKVQNCIQELTAIMQYATTLSTNISLFACSIGAYFSLLAFKNEALEKCIFLSPVVDMNRMIDNMMKWFHVTEKQLEAELAIITPIGQTLYWDYYCYVKEHPIDIWDKATFILYGSQDNVCESDTITAFANKFNCHLQLIEQAEHYFHTPEQLDVYRRWVTFCISK